MNDILAPMASLLSILDDAEQRFPRLYRVTRDDMYALIERAGDDSRPVELLAGRLIDMANRGPEHGQGINLADYALRPVFGKGFAIRVQLPLAIDKYNQPAPDVAVVRGAPREHVDHPDASLAVLVVEVAKTTLQYDRVTKGSRYASRQVPDYWIVNLIDDVVEIYRDPGKDKAAEFGWSYATTLTLGPGKSVAPRAAPRKRVRIADLLA